MKSTLCACVFLFFVTVGQCQWGGFWGRPHPLNNNWGMDPLTTALLLGFDYTELMALNQMMGGPRGGGMRPRQQQQAMRDIEALAAMGLIDGPDGPDRAGGGAGGKKGGAAGGKPGPARRGGGRGEEAPPPRRQNGPRRRNRNKNRNA